MRTVGKIRSGFVAISMLATLAITVFFQSGLPAHAAPLPVVVFDPGNSSSYPGSGTTVTSIGSNSLTGTMSNITYGPSLGGTFTFGGNSSISFNSFDFTNTFTITAWVKPNTSTNINTLVSNIGPGGATNGFKVFWNSYVTSDRKMIVETGNGSSGAGAVTDGAAVTYATWQHLAYVVNRTSGTAAMYVNGVLQASTVSTAIRTDFATNQTWWIGSMTGSNYFMNGELGLFKVYSSTLSGSEVSAEYNATQGRYVSPVNPVITVNPSNASVPAGTSATYSVTSTISDAGTQSYQWQVSTNSGSTWNNVANGTGGSTSAYQTVATTVSMTNYQYRVIVTNTLNGSTATTTSSAATLTVTKAVPNVTLSVPIGTITPGTFRSLIAITLTSNTAGKISIKANGKWVAGCRNLNITSTIICNYKPALHGQIAVTASFVPSLTSDYSSVTTAPAYVATSARTNRR